MDDPQGGDAFCCHRSRSGYRRCRARSDARLRHAELLVRGRLRAHAELQQLHVLRGRKRRLPVGVLALQAERTMRNGKEEEQMGLLVRMEQRPLGGVQ